MKERVGILSLGCPRNLIDSENILSRLIKKDYQLVDINDCDIAILNTCAFIKDAKQESIDAILDLIELKKKGKIKKIVVYGCLVERYKDDLKKHIPEVDAYIGTLGLESSDFKRILTPEHFAYVKISEGCISNCSFCIIPKIKGAFKSRDIDSIIKEILILERAGVKEINLIGQDISVYGIDLYKRPSLKSLLKRIIKETKDIKWIRLLYLNPNYIDDGLLKFINDNPRICRYLDIPLQHINDRILRLMNRKISRKKIIELLNKARKIIPGVAIRTSLIVGFPTESQLEFEELLNFIKEARFERLGVFVYSREEGTRAFNLKGQIPFKTKASRFDKIMVLQQDISKEVNARFEGSYLKAIVDEFDKKENIYIGRTEFDAPEVDGSCIIRSKKKISVGDFVNAKVIDTFEYDLVLEA